ncbi:MAG TPA: ScyD/ScyE family protein [Pyrinomonadaceae bacterium]|nr:ScyD/ScyE family protein [Pyrinomonadaceae bacterium]
MSISKLIPHVIMLTALMCVYVPAQTTSVFTTGLTTPNKIIAAGDNSLLVTEAGTTTPNTGRLSRIDRTSGARQTLIAGLPSAVNTGPTVTPPEVSGPSSLLLHGHVLYMTISTGDSVIRTPPFEIPNPTPSSPIFASVLKITMPGSYEQVTSPFTVVPANHTTLANGDPVTLTNADGESLTIEMVANLPNSVPNPLPTNPDNHRQSNLFGIERWQKHLYLVDASFNLIYRVDEGDGTFETFVTFPSRPNPTPVGPPMIEAVPDSVHRFGNRLIVTLLTGFPFVQGLSEVRAVELKDGGHSVLIPGLTTAIDSLKIGDDDDGVPTFAPGDDSSFYTLEFSTDFLAGAPGRLRFYSAPDATPVNVLTNLITPTAMARDAATGNLFIVNLGPGTVTRVTGLANIKAPAEVTKEK